MSREAELDPERLARSPDYVRLEIDLAPGQELLLDAAAWREAILFVTAGEIEVQCGSGQRRRFAREAILCVAPTVRLLRNGGNEPARLIAISRRVGG